MADKEGGAMSDEALIEKLSAAEEGSDELDFEIWLALNPNDDTVRRWFDKLAEMSVSDRLHWASRFTPCAKYTTSLNAIVSLCMEKFGDALIGTDYSIGFDNDIPGLEENPRWNAWCYGESAEHPTSPAIALTISFLRALQAMEA